MPTDDERPGNDPKHERASPDPTDNGARASRKDDAPTQRRKGLIDPDLAADDAPGPRNPGDDLRARQEQLIDEAVEETFPASDPIAPKRITK
jgi:hypothetical protein